MKAFGLAAVLLAVVACGQAAVQPSSSAGPSTSSSGLFAVLHRVTPDAQRFDAVAIEGIDGRERAQATFLPMAVPTVGCMGAILPPSAHVAAGKVYFADAKGVVRSLAVDGTVATAATFPITSTQQMLSFAVSPDGTRLLGTVYTIPTTASACGGSPSGTFTLDAYSAANGGVAQLVYHQSWTKPQNVLALTGWDSIGPIGTYPTVWASQGGGPSSTLGVKVRVDGATIKPGAAFSDPSECLAWDSNQKGTFVCTNQALVSVRRADGTELWHFTTTGDSPALSPDGQRVLICCGTAGSELVLKSDGSSSELVKGFFARAWLDDQTAIGEVHTDPLQQPPLTLGYVTLGAPGTVVSLHLTGALVGAVR